MGTRSPIQLKHPGVSTAPGSCCLCPDLSWPWGGEGAVGGATPPPNSKAFPPQGGSSGAQPGSPQEQTGKEGSAASHPSLGLCLPLALCMKILVSEDPLTSSQSIELLREAFAGTPALGAGRGCAKGPTQPGLFQEARARHTSRCCSALAA